MTFIEEFHPTKRALLLATAELLETKTPQELRTEEVLEMAHVSKGSLYHHFRDLTQLLEAAQVFRYGQFIDSAVEGVNNLVDQARTREDMVQGMKMIAAIQQSENLRQSRNEQFSQLAAASKSEEMKAGLGREQERLTNALADLFRHSIVRGWANPAIDPRAAAVFARAITIGKIVDDVTRDQMEQKNYLMIIELVLENVFFPSNS
ncbi:MAG: TetR/AcrR family transcriptional regulator [Actinomycetes bacterium]